MADAIDSNVTPLCVPIDPLGWLYARDCKLLNPEAKIKPFRFEAVNSSGLNHVYNAKPPASIAGKNIISLAVLVKPATPRITLVNTKAIVQLKDGSSQYFTGERKLKPNGSLILLLGDNNISGNDIASVRLEFDTAVEIAITADAPDGVPAIHWMGNSSD